MLGYTESVALVGAEIAMAGWAARSLRQIQMLGNGSEVTQVTQFHPGEARYRKQLSSDSLSNGIKVHVVGPIQSFGRAEH